MSIMNEHLLCNIIKCYKVLKTHAWVTSCSHIFCMEHGQIAVEKGRCLCCNTTFSTEYDIVAINLDPNDEFKSVALAGLSPDKILDIANRAINFWFYQKHEEKVILDKRLKASKEQFQDLVNFYESLQNNHKMLSDKFKRVTEEHQTDLNEKESKLQELTTQLIDKSNLLKHIQSQNDALKRQLTTFKSKYETPNDDYDTGNEMRPYPKYVNQGKIDMENKFDANCSKYRKTKEFLFNPFPNDL